MHAWPWLVIGGLCAGQSCGPVRALDTGDPYITERMNSPCGNSLFPAADSDFDGLCDAVDNCPTLFNPDQLDADQNGIGDKCEVPPPDPLEVSLTLTVEGRRVEIAARTTGGTEPYRFQWAASPNPAGFFPFQPFQDPGAADVAWTPPCGQPFVLTVTVNDAAIPLQIAVASTPPFLIPCE